MTAVATRTSVRFEPPDADGIARIVIDRPDDAVNAVNVQLTEDLAEAVRSARATDNVRGLIMASNKPDQWVAGADLNVVSEASDGRQTVEAVQRFQAVVDELAWLPCTSVAAIIGPALGGGLELALACDYRVASDVAAVSLGQPEVNLGLLPAGGGTQRLPRLIGLERALDIILNGRRLNARRSRRAGLLDEVVHPSVLEQAARRWAAKPKRPLDRPISLGLNARAALDVAEQTAPGRQLIYRQARQAVLARTQGHYPAPLKALEAVEIGFERGMAAGLEAEAEAFAELAKTQTARHLIWLFLARQRARRRSRSQPVSHLGVVGAGFMGAAIAEVGAAAELNVRVKDVNPDAVAKGLASVRKIVDAGVARRRFEPREGRDIMRRVSGTTQYDGFARTDVVIEAVFEDVALKRQVLHDLEAVVGPDTVIASNTSAIPIAEIAREAAHPERVVGMHFFSPVERMPLLEVVRPSAAADRTVERAVGLGTRMGKTVIVVADSPGFYTSRVLGTLMNEATLMHGEGASIEDVDRALVAFGFPVGPFVLHDEVGLEVAQHVGETLARAYGERIPVATIVADLVGRGETGRKSGRGFYVWPPKSRLPGFLPQPKRATNPFVSERAPHRNFDEKDIQERLVLLFVNEAIRCLDEAVLQSPTDGDLGAVLGLGFPPFTGGPFHYADSLGLQTLTHKLTELAARHGPRFEPAESLSTRTAFY